MSEHPSRFHLHLGHLHQAFGADASGRRAEAFARWFGTPAFLIAQTAVVVAWIACNVAWRGAQWDPYPFILLNLGFSLQAAYAAPLILLAQTRQADRDKALSEADAQHREALAQAAADRQQIALELAQKLQQVLAVNTDLTERVERLTAEIHRRVC